MLLLLDWLCVVLRVVFDECCFVVCRFLLFGVVGSGFSLLTFVARCCLWVVFLFVSDVRCVLSLFVVSRVLFVVFVVGRLSLCVYWLWFVVLHLVLCGLLFWS